PHCIHVRVALPPISIFVCTLFRFLFLFLFLFFFFFFFFFNDPATTEIYTLSLHDALPIAIRGATVDVPTLSGTKRIRVPAGTQHGTVQRLRGEGPPKLGGKGRGDIHYRLSIDVPRSLSREQKRAVDDLAQVMDGNPRERLFAGKSR